MQKTNFPIEILIHDDASTDGTTELIQTYEAKYPELIKPTFQIINQYSQGKKITPILISKAQGKYIALCEGDDYWTDPLKLQKQVDFLEENEEFSGSFHNTYFSDENNEGNSLTPWRKYDKQKYTILDTISSRSLFHTSSFLFRNPNQKLPEWFSKVQSGDMALFSIIAQEGSLYRFDDFMSVYRKNPTSITNSISETNLHKNRILFWNNFRSYCSSQLHSQIEEVLNCHRKELKRLKPTIFQYFVRKSLWIKKR